MYTCTPESKVQKKKVRKGLKEWKSIVLQLLTKRKIVCNVKYYTIQNLNKYNQAGQIKKDVIWWLIPVIPALWEVEVGGSVEVRSSRPAWPAWQNPVSTKNTQISQAWRRMSVIPATWEAEVGESLEPRRWKLQ